MTTEVSIRRRHRGRARGPSAFTLLEIMIVVTIIGLLAALALPSFVKARTDTQRKVCIENLTQIESAKQVWALDEHKNEGDTPTPAQLIGVLLYIRVQPACPAQGEYSFNPVGSNATCTVAGHAR